MITNTYNPDTLLVTRDGFIDETYYNALYAQKRSEALRTAGREALSAMLQAPVLLGKGAMLVIHSIAEQANPNLIKPIDNI